MARLEILSPLPGTFYRSPSPEQPPFKSPGDAVAKGDTIGLIEVMKTFIEVKAEVAGTLLRFAIENESPISPGELIAEVEG